MKIKGLFILVGFVTVMLASCGKSAIQNAKMKSVEDSVSYAFGIVNYNALMTDSLVLNPALVAKAMMDGEDGDAVMTDEEARSLIMDFINKRELAKNEVAYEDYIAENESFLSKNKEKEGIKVTPSGLQYEVIKMGDGPTPTAESTVKVHYVGTLIDGTQFDSSVERGEPATFPVSGVIPGWTEALQLMPVGSKFKLYIPQAIAYGGNGAGEMIKPYSTLIFEVELLEIVQ